MFLWKAPKNRTRLLCTSGPSQAAVWPYAFSLLERGLRPLCQWASFHGARVHPALRVIEMGHKGLGVITVRDLPAGTPLMSVPLHIGLVSAREHRDDDTPFHVHPSPVEQLAHAAVRGLVNDDFLPKTYLEFLHDAHNADSDAALSDNAELQDNVDQLLHGNALVIGGVRNAPFLTRHAFQTGEVRVEWAKYQRLQRELQQAVPHFVAHASAWALSMVLSRALPCDDGEMMMLPIVDLLNHGTTPTARYFISDPRSSVSSARSRPHNSSGTATAPVPTCPHFDTSVRACHVVSVGPLRKRQEVSLQYSSRRCDSLVDAEYWMLRWGFVPARPSVKKRSSRCGCHRQR